MIDLERKTFGFFGVRQSGKSTLANEILRQHGQSAVLYDTLGEAPATAPYYFYEPKNRYSTPELEQFLKNWVIPPNQQTAPRFSMAIIDECNRFAPPKPSPLPASIAHINDEGRHYPMSFGFIARRPCQINQDLTELADYLFIFRLAGKADIKWLNDTVDGLGDTVRNMPPFHFAVVYPDRHYEVMQPITPAGDWLNKAEERKNK